MTDDFSGKLGEDYDVFTKVFTYYDQLEENIGSFLAHLAKSNRSPAISVIEIGCGTGITTKRILEANPRINVTALDLSPVMIRQAESNLKGYVSRGIVSFVQQDAVEYLLDNSIVPEGSIDCVVSASTIHNLLWPDRLKLYSGAYRVLKRGGAFINGDKIAQDDPEEHERCLSYDLALLDKMVELGRPDLKEKWMKHYMRDNQRHIILRESEFMTNLNAVGFIDVKKIYRQYTSAIITGVKQWAN